MKTNSNGMVRRKVPDPPLPMRVALSLRALITRQPALKTGLAVGCAAAGISPMVAAYLADAPWFGWMFAIIVGGAAVVTAALAQVLDVE